MKIAFLGTGLMGSGFVRRLLADGHQVATWNRDPAKARALEAAGARACADAAEAVRGVERVHLALADDASVDAVLEPLVVAIAATAWILDHTTTAPTPTAERAARWSGRGRRYLHVPVFMSPANAAEGSGYVLLSGRPDWCDAVEPMLARMCTTVMRLGDSPERAASFKLFGNLVIVGINAVLGDVNRLAKSVGIGTAEAFALFDTFNPGKTLPARCARIAAGNFSQPSFEVSMARKDVRLMIEEAQRHGMALRVMPAIAALYDEAIARGEGGLDTAVVSRA